MVKIKATQKLPKHLHQQAGEKHDGWLHRVRQSTGDDFQHNRHAHPTKN